MFTDNGDGTVTDSLSGLLWQKTVDAGLNSWADAKAYCAALALAGKGWRLPTKAELQSIVDFGIGIGHPAIDPVTFPSTASTPFWTSSTAAGSTPSLAWEVHFTTGGGGPASLSSKFNVRCVSSSAPVVASAGVGGAPPGRYNIDAVNGTVTDTLTQLTWQRAVDPGTYTQADAASYCTALTLAGGGWRLPQLSELFTLVDPTQSKPAIDPTAFPTPADVMFWSSNQTYSVAFYYGALYGNNPTDTLRVRCVR